MEYGTIKRSIVRISPLYLKNYLILVNRWSTEEFGRFGCLADNIGPRETEPFEKFFESFYDWRKRSFLDQSFSKGKGKINVALSDSQLTATVSTDFMDALGHAARREPLDVKADLFIKIEDITIKVNSY